MRTMAAKSLFFALVAVCVCSGLNAVGPSFPRPEEFLAQVQAARDVVAGAVQENQGLLLNAEEKENALTKVVIDVAKWRMNHRLEVFAQSEEYKEQGVDVAECMSAYDADMDSIVRRVNKEAEELLKRDFELVEAAGATDLLSAADEVLGFAEKEAASDNYGANVRTLLAQIGQVESLVQQGSKPAVLNSLTFAAELGDSDAEAVASYAGFCMREAARNQQ